MSEIRTFALRRPSWRVWLAGAFAVIVLGTLFIARIAGAGSDDDGATSTGARSGSSQQPGGTDSATPDPSASPGGRTAPTGRRPPPTPPWPRPPR